MARRSRAGTHWIAATLLIAGLLLPWTPAAVQTAIQTAILDLAAPGQHAWMQARKASREWLAARLEVPRHQQKIDRLRRELQAERQRRRQQELHNAELNQELASSTRQPPFQAQPGEPLLVPELIEAAVYGQSTVLNTVRRLLVHPEQSADINPDMLVLETGLTLIDQGRQQELEIGQPVYSAAAVVGRVEAVGQWVSSIRLVTDPEYRGRARLARETSRGLVWGSEGRLEGQGTDLCRLFEIPATESVAVGDRVFSGDRQGALPFPMSYGVVERAELPEGAEEWLIEVRPAFESQQLRRVTVLRDKLNVARTLAN